MLPVPAQVNLRAKAGSFYSATLETTLVSFGLKSIQTHRKVVLEETGCRLLLFLLGPRTGYGVQLQETDPFSCDAQQARTIADEISYDPKQWLCGHWCPTVRPVMPSFTLPRCLDGIHERPLPHPAPDYGSRPSTTVAGFGRPHSEWVLGCWLGRSLTSPRQSGPQRDPRPASRLDPKNTAALFCFAATNNLTYF